MNERPIRSFLTALRRAVRQVRLYPDGHPLTDEALRAAETAADLMVGTDAEIVLSLHEDAFYIDKTLLPHTSLEFGALLQEMQGRGIDSISIYPQVNAADIGDLAMFIAGVAADLPVEGTIGLNEVQINSLDLDSLAMSGLRRTYASTLDVLRSVTTTAGTGSEFELGGVVWAVEGLLEQSIGNPNASLLLSTVKSHDEYTFFHSVNTCILTLTLGRLVGIGEDQLKLIGVGALLHDIGKMSVSARILQFPGRLDEEQWKEIKLHPQEGAQAILAAGGDGFEVAAMVAFEHHARYDGTGYPVVTRKGRPHAYSRLVSVADTYDAITTRRSYRRAETPNRALHVLLNGAGSHWDPDMVRSIIATLGIYPPGSIVRLHDGSIMVTTASVAGDDRELSALLVVTGGGERIDPVAVRIDPSDVADQLLPSEVGIDPSELLEASGLETSNA